MSWLDSPGEVTDPSHVIVGADVKFSFAFQAIAPDGSVGCGGSFTLHWKFGPGTGITDPLKGWTITDAVTY